MSQLRESGDPQMGQVAERCRYADVTENEISTARMASLVADPRCGALVTFDGVVRDHDGGKGVLRLVYSMHPSAPSVMADVVAEVAGRHPDAIIAAVHRVGPLTIGETALAAAVSAPHRKAAFVACDDLVDTVKKRLPIWKEQGFTDGTSEWVNALD